MSTTIVIERVLKRRYFAALRILCERRGVDVKIYKRVNDVHVAVYGIDAGGPPQYGEEFQTVHGLITGDEFYPTSGFSSGTFGEGWLYTVSDIPAPHDIASIVTADGKTRRFTIEHREAVGTTMNVFWRYKLAAMGD